jgi:hypothetical protein
MTCKGLKRDPVRPRPLGEHASGATVIAGAEGLSTVSMQRLASDPGDSKIALYRCVTSMDKLITAMIENAVGDPPDLGSIPASGRPGSTNRHGTCAPRINPPPTQIRRRPAPDQAAAKHA